MKRFRGNSRGDILINLLAASAILMAITVGILSLMQNMFKGSKRLSGKIDVDQLRLFVTGMIACDKTIPPPPVGCAAPGPCPCTPDASGFKTVKDAFGNTVISGDPATPTKVGIFTLRAECSGDSVIVKATVLANGGTLNSTVATDFGPHPSTNKPVLWSETKSNLFPAGAALCRSGNIESRLAALQNDIAILQSQVADLMSWRTSAEAAIADHTAKLNNILSNTCANVPVRAVGGFEATGAQKCAPAPHDYNGDGYNDLVIAAGPTGGPRVSVISGLETGGGGSMAPRLADFFAYAPAFTGGATTGLVDIDGDGYADVLTAAGPGGAPHVSAFKGNGGGQPPNIRSYYGFETTFTGGVIIGP